MSDLHPTARALIDAARRGESSLPPDARARVHRSVLRRAVAVGAAVSTTSTASAVSKAAALVATLSSPFAIPGVMSAIAGVAFLVLRAGSATQEPPHDAPPAPAHAVTRVARSAPDPIPIAHETPAVAPSAVVPPAVTQEPAPVGLPDPAPAPPSPSKPLAFAASPPSPAAAHGHTAAAAVPAAEPPAAIEPSTTGDEPPQSAPAAAALTPGLRASAPGPADLLEDLDRLRQVHAALRAGRFQAALSLLDREGEGLEAGPLAEEAQAARISALCQLGRLAEARAATDRFLATWPASPLAMRLRGVCAGVRANSNPEGD